MTSVVKLDFNWYPQRTALIDMLGAICARKMLPN